MEPSLPSSLHWMMETVRICELWSHWRGIRGQLLSHLFLRALERRGFLEFFRDSSSACNELFLRGQKLRASQFLKEEQKTFFSSTFSTYIASYIAWKCYQAGCRVIIQGRIVFVNHRTSQKEWKSSRSILHVIGKMNQRVYMRYDSQN